MRVGILFSGGKDSTFAVHWSKMQGWDVKCLLTIRSHNTDSWMFHTPNIDLVKEQAHSLAIPLMTHDSEGQKEEELNDLQNLLLDAKKEHHLIGIVTGAIASEYQRIRVNNVCERIGLKVFSPFWHKNPEQYMKEITETGYSFLLTRVAAEGLTKEFLGRIINNDSVAWFIEHCKKNQVHPAGEGGEYESFVIDGPLFTQKMIVEDSETDWDGSSGLLKIKRINAKQKS